MPALGASGRNESNPRGDEVLIAHSNTVIHEEDHVIIFLVNKRYITEVEKLFQVGAIYF